jgi:tetratricopeptide (TPR) repeat protein
MKQSNWSKNIITAFISIGVTVAGGLILFYLQNKEPKLEYSVENIPPFESQLEKLNIYHITISNAGNNVAEDIVCKIKIVPATIKEYRINSETPIRFTDSISKQDVDIATSTLNPKESYRVSILATTNTSFPEKPLVSLRAKGITAVENSVTDSEKKGKNFLYKMLYVLMGISASASFLTLIIRKKMINDDSTMHSGDQNEIIAYLCGIHGLDLEVDRFLNLPRKASYWAQMDRLAATAIAKNDKDNIEKIIKVILAILNYASMADTSKGIGYYNLGRLYKSIGDIENSEKYIAEANKIIPKLLATRQKLDPLFDY